MAIIKTRLDGIIPKSFALNASQVKLAGRSYIDPSMINGNIPANNCVVASVATIDGILSFVIKMPFTYESAAPAIIPTGINTSKGTLVFPTNATATPITDIIAPADTSMFPVIMMIFIPMAAIRR